MTHAPVPTPAPGSLAGKAVLLTGASRGIGAATAAALGAAGAELVAHYGSHRDGAAAAVAAIPEERRTLVQADLGQPGAARELWRQAVAWRERIDVVVVNAAINVETPFDGTDEQWDAGWDAMLRVNVLESASLIREAVRHFVTHGGGTLVVLSSWVAQQGSGIAQLSGYAASKAAIGAVMQTVARNYAKDGVLAYAISPGIVETQMSEISAVVRGGVDAVKAALAMGEMVPPAEIGSLVVFLATGACRHLTGATLDVNGATYVR
jgi:NAD(P)-dependent dehydrogenase (short-subunit alcohol dehydrogenase family)